MTLEEVKAELITIEIAAYRKDNEVAHDREDELHQEVLRHIATHCKDEECKNLASKALESLDIEFTRWYA